MPRRASPSMPAALMALALVAAAVPDAWGAVTPPPGADPPAQGAAAATTSRARFLMGTRLTVTIAGRAGEDVFDQVFAEVSRLENVLSNWDAESELSRLNRSAADGPVRCSEELWSAVTLARRWAEETDGAFDPTVEPLVRRLGLRGVDGRWDRAPGADSSVRDDAPVGWRHLRLEPRTRSVRFDAPGVGIDLGGIGKGIALDAAARVLGMRAVGPALLDFGGQVLAVGPGDGGAWPVGVADPGDRDGATLWVTLRAASLATSANGERSGTDGAGHILDPARGAPAAYTGSVTVLAEDATTADALSTALFVMGPESGINWAEKRGIGVLYQWRAADGTAVRRTSREFPAFLPRGVPASGRTAK